MTRGQTDWTLAGKLRRRGWIAIAIITVFMSAVVALHYGTDMPELRHRSLHMLGERFARDAELAYRRNDWEIINSRHRIFQQHPEDYAWAVLDAEGHILASSPDTPSAEELWVASGPFPDVWTSQTNEGGWIGGRSFSSGTFKGFAVIEIREDSAGLLPLLIAGEFLVHVVLPIAPFALLLIFGLEAALRMTIEPIRRYSRSVSEIEPGKALEPLDMTRVPVEFSGIVERLNNTILKLNTATEREKEFIAEAAHSLRTPLAALKARLELDGNQAPADMLKAEVEALVRLTNQLLMSANADKLTVDPEAVADLSEVARSVVARVAPRAVVAGIDLGVEGAETCVAVPGNADALAQALHCLLENALQVTPRGGSIAVSVGREPPRLTVSDTGPGFHAGSRAFTPARPAVNNDEVRAGLGLRIARQIATAHNAELSIGQAEGGGARVSVDFRASQQVGPVPETI